MTAIILLNVFILLLTVLFITLNLLFHATWMLTAFITFLTIFYHFFMRLCVGETVDWWFRHHDFIPSSSFLTISSFETTIYRKLRVKQWKALAITAKPEYFDLTKVTPEELMRNMYQAEMVHEFIVILSFVPLFLIIPFGAPAVFIITSVMAALIDMQFVIIQRYNRPRVERLLHHHEA